jgi:ATP-binding cassette subfamily B protein
MGKLIRFCRKYIPAMIVALVLGAIGTIFQIVGPNRLRDMTNEIVKGMPAIVNGKPIMHSIDFSAVNRIAWILVALYVGSALLNYVQSWMMATVTQRTAQELRGAISVKINKLPLKYFDKTSYGDILSRITNDVDAIGQTLGQSVGALITSVTLFFGSLVMMFANNVILTLCAIVASLVGFALMSLIMKFSQKYFVQQQKALGDVNGHVEEMYAGHTVVKAYGGEPNSIRTFERYNGDLYASGWKSQFFSGLMMPLMMFVGNLGFVVVCAVGGALALNGKIEFGVIVAFMMYIRLFTQPLAQFATAFQNLQRCAAASERVFGFLEEPEMADESAKQPLLGRDAAGNPVRVRGDVDFAHVSFGYSPEKTIIHDFSAAVRAGQKVAIVGPTGAGKTTMVNLLMRFYEITGGSISIDGIDTKSVPRANVHDQFSMVLQDTWVFQGTVRENIAYARTDVSDQQIIDACKAVGLDHYIRSLPEGLRHGARRQGLALARPEAAAHHRASHGAERADSDSGRGDILGRHPYRRADSEGHGRPDRRPHELRDRAPAFDHQERRHDSRDGSRRHRRARHPRRAAQGQRLLRRPLQQPVRPDGLSLGSDFHI